MTPLSLAAVLAVPLLTGGCFERTQPSAENLVRPVQVARVVNSRVADSRVYAGTVQPRREADIAFRANGRIVTREVDIGRRVHAGEELAKLDPADLALSERSAEADFASARAQLIQAAADAARSHTLTGQGWTAAATDEVKQAAARSAAERVTSAQAALNLARNRLDYAVLRAPADGTITAVMADPGTVVSEGQAVMRLAEAGTPEVAVALPEGAAGLAPGAPAQVSVWAHPEAALPAHLRELSRSADPKLRTYTARFAMDGPVAPDWMALGMTATVRLDRADPAQPEAATLPAAALADRGTGQMVWVVDPQAGTLEARAVQVRELRQDRAVVSGLRDGELVVSLGVQKLDPAARVRVAGIRTASATLAAE